MKERLDPKMLLLEAFGYNRYGNEVDKYPFEMRLLDWDKAIETNAIKKPWTFLSEFCWNLFLAIGFKKERVLRVVDPALVPLVSRVLDLPILPLGSCSGHPIKKSHPPYLQMVFRDAEFGYDFHQTCVTMFADSAPKLIVYGHTTHALQSYVGPGMLGRFFPVGLPAEVSIANYLSIELAWETASHEEYPLLWSRFSRVLDRFDGKGEYTPTRTALRQRVVMEGQGELFDEVLRALFTAVEKVP